MNTSEQGMKRGHSRWFYVMQGRTKAIGSEQHYFFAAQHFLAAQHFFAAQHFLAAQQVFLLLAFFLAEAQAFLAEAQQPVFAAQAEADGFAAQAAIAGIAAIAEAATTDAPITLFKVLLRDLTFIYVSNIDKTRQ